MGIVRKYNLDLLKLIICLVYFVTPLESIGVSEESNSFSIVKAVVLLLLVVWTFTSRKLDLNPVTRIFTVMGFFWLASCVWALSTSIAFNNLVNFYLPSLILIMIVGKNIDTTKDIRNILVSYLLGCVVLAIYCVMSRDEILANAVYSEMERVTALGQDHNELAFLLVMGFVVVLQGFQFYSIKWVNLFLIGCSLLFLYAILLTGSRTGVIMVLFVVCLFVWNNKKRTISLLPFIIIAMPIIISQVPEGSVERILNTKESLTSGDLTNRGEIWAKGYRAFVQENMVLGVGYQNFSEMMRLHYGAGGASHNTYLSYLITGGFVGIIFLTTILVKLYKYCRAIVRYTRNSYWYAYIFPIVIAMLTLETQYRRWLFLIGIVIYKAYQISKHEHETYIEQ